ncbi:MAG: diaminopimelate epimerase, partial [Bacteroidetes bacterium]
LDNRKGELNLHWEQAAKILCNRHYGIGADGLIIIETSKVADFRMNYFNADGSYGGMCGNGGRCSALFVLQGSSNNTTTFDALDYIYSAKKADSNISLSMKDPKDLSLNRFIQINQTEIKINFVNTGSPHVVVYSTALPDFFQEDIEQNGIAGLGSSIRNHQLFAPDGTNVNFVHVISGNAISMRTYERGVEGETLACGTGAVASALVTNALHRLPSPIEVHTRSNEILLVSFIKRDNGYSTIELTGSANVVFHGIVKLDSHHYRICT